VWFNLAYFAHYFDGLTIAFILPHEIQISPSGSTESSPHWVAFHLTAATEIEALHPSFMLPGGLELFDSTSILIREREKHLSLHVHTYGW
jgi:hypothetical protein